MPIADYTIAVKRTHAITSLDRPICFRTLNLINSFAVFVHVFRSVRRSAATISITVQRSTDRHRRYRNPKCDSVCYCRCTLARFRARCRTRVPRVCMCISIVYWSSKPQRKRWTIYGSSRARTHTRSAHDEAISFTFFFCCFLLACSKFFLLRTRTSAHACSIRCRRVCRLCVVQVVDSRLLN